jgi:glycosyltransferase involved in cell wall biosynthesis
MLTYNRLEYTKATLESLFAHTTWPYRLKITDNGSVDETIPYLESLVSEGRVHELHVMGKNLGNAGGKNYELTQVAKTEHVCLLDNDMLLKPDWLRKEMECLLAFREQGLVLMSPWPIWKFAPNTRIGELRRKRFHVVLTRKLSGQVWVGLRQPLLEAGGFEQPKNGRFMGFFASPLSKKLVKNGMLIGCVADQELAVSMDRAGSPIRVETEEMKDYREWNRLQKNKHQVLPDFHVWRKHRR